MDTICTGSSRKQEIMSCSACMDGAKRIFLPKRTPREAAIWDLIYENVLSSYSNELDWINKARQTLNQFDIEKYEGDMMSEGERLSEDFIRLRTGIAGAVLQSFPYIILRLSSFGMKIK